MHSLDASDTSPDTATVAGRILAAQRLRGLSDTALARASGITRQAVAALCAGGRAGDGSARVAVATIAALAPALGCDPAWLAFGAPYAAPRSAPPTLPGIAAEAEAPEHGSPLPVAQLRAQLDAARATLPAYVAPAPSTLPASDPLAALSAARAEALDAVRAGLARGETQGSIARAAGVPQSALSNALAGRTVPTAATVARLVAWARRGPGAEAA